MIRDLSSVVVAIPVKDEAEHIAKCLYALSQQSGHSQYQVLLLLNNCSDDSAAIVRELAPSLPIPIRQIQVTLPPEHATAGFARRLAFEAAARCVRSGGILLTTDADACVYPNWIEANLGELQKGVDAVAGRIEIDPVDAALIPSKLHEDDARECAYAALLDEINARLDPNAFDPWPRHSEHSGASIAVTADAYRRAGGIPAVALGEDRAFCDALRRVDARIRHSTEARVVVSGRILGRAVGGMADTIRRRMIKPDEMLDAGLEPAFDAAWRARMRRFVRMTWSARDALNSFVPLLSQALMLRSEELRTLFSLPHFGAAWANIEMRSARLAKKRVPVRDLELQTERARSILQACAEKRFNSALLASADPGDIPALGGAVSDRVRLCTPLNTSRPLRPPDMDSQFGRSNAPVESDRLASS